MKEILTYGFPDGNPVDDILLISLDILLMVSWISFVKYPLRVSFVRNGIKLYIVGHFPGEEIQHIWWWSLKSEHPILKSSPVGLVEPPGIPPSQRSMCYSTSTALLKYILHSISSNQLFSFEITWKLCDCSLSNHEIFSESAGLWKSDHAANREIYDFYKTFKFKNAILDIAFWATPI